MTAHDTAGALNGATTQYDRLVSAVAADSIVVDARTFCELLNFGPELAKLVRFYDLHDRPNGDWLPFFLTDPTIILASIVAFDLTAFEKKLWEALRLARNLRTLPQAMRQLWQCYEQILSLAKHIDDWGLGAVSAHSSRPARLLAKQIHTAIDSGLQSHLQGLVSVFRSMPSTGDEGQARDAHAAGFSAIWRLKDESRSGLPSGNELEQELVDYVVDLLEVVARAFIFVFKQIQAFAEEELPATLLESDHRPQIALYIAFVQLFRNAQHTINTLTRRFTNFYYSKVLQEGLAGPIPDSVYVVLSLDPSLGTTATADVPTGTLFVGGKEPDGSPILYASNESTTVTAATVTNIRCTRIETSYGNGAQQVFGTEIDIGLMNKEAVGKGLSSGLIPWPTFGYAAVGADDISVTNLLSLGFAVGSDYLMLTGGTRQIDLTFALPATSLPPALQVAAEATGLTPDDVFAIVVESALTLWFTTTAEWFHPDSFVCSSALSDPAPWFTISVTLSAAAPPIVSYDPPPNAPPPADPQPPDDLDPSIDKPSMKAYLDQGAVSVSGPNGSTSVYPLSVLSAIVFDSLTLGTTTTGLTDLTVASSMGPVDITKPYPIFGGVAVVGSYLQFSNPELFVKEPTSGTLAVSIDWYGLPVDETGFAGYYKGYVIGLDGQKSKKVLFDNRSFRSLLEVVNPGTWSIVPPSGAPDSDISRTDLYLFRSDDNCDHPEPQPANALCGETDFTNLTTSDTDPPPFYDPADSAIRLTLTDPPYAFGNILYAPNVMYAAIEELPKPWLASGAEEGCQSLKDAADALEAQAYPSPGTKPTKSEMADAARQVQVRLLQSAQGFLSTCLGKESGELAAWVSATFDVPGSTALPYRARVAGKRLRSAITALEAGGNPAPGVEFPTDAIDTLQCALIMLDAVVWIQEALDAAAPEPDATYAATLQAQLSVVIQKLRQAYAAGMLLKKKAPYPNPPWMAQAQQVSVSYSATCTIWPSGTEDTDNLYAYLLPYGGYSVTPSSGGSIPLLAIPQQSSLEVGFSGMSAAQQLTLLFQMQAYCAEDSLAVTWQRQTETGWAPFDNSEIPFDTTNGLQNSGTLRLDLPQAEWADASGYRWIRAITSSPDTFPQSIGIYPHVLTATWTAESGGSGEHLDQPLAPYSIAASVQNLAAIQTITNPMASFGGVPAQTPDTFRTDLSERLRHKDRAVLSWDYERLVLEAFPNIWQAQALPAVNPQGLSSPGDVLVVVVPGPHNSQLTDPTAPIATSDVLEGIKSFLSKRASPFASIAVTNPVYVRIKVIAEVLFGDQSDTGATADQLNTSLTQYLSPWFYDVSRAKSQGAYASEDAIVYFIQSQPYVDSITKISFVYDPLPDTLHWYLLTSATSHDIVASASPVPVGSKSSGA